MLTPTAAWLIVLALALFVGAVKGLAWLGWRRSGYLLWALVPVIGWAVATFGTGQ